MSKLKDNSTDDAEITVEVNATDDRIAVLEDLLRKDDERVLQLEDKVSELERKLKAAKSAPIGDVVFLNGKSYAVKLTVRADNNFIEVKRGIVDEGCTMVVIDKAH